MIGGDCGCAHMSPMSGGAPRGKSLAKETKATLYEMAKKHDIKGRSKMTKEQLVEAIRKKQNASRRRAH